MTINTYPYMNKEIKNILKASSNPFHEYVLKRIEELEGQVEAYEKQLQKFINGGTNE